MNTFIRLLYSLLIAAAVVTFVGVGIYTFYPAPKAPVYPEVVSTKGESIGPSAEQQRSYNKANEQYQKDNVAYSRNISLVGTVLAAGIIVGGLYVRRRADIIGEGLSLGGIATSIYAVAMASIADDRVMRFIAVTVFLAGAILVVYIQFNDKVVKPAAKAKK